MTEDPDHGPMLSAAEVAALLGVDVDELTEAVMAQRTGTGTQTVRLPGRWLDQGKSRRDIYQQATGRTDMDGALRFWMAQRTSR